MGSTPGWCQAIAVGRNPPRPGGRQVLRVGHVGRAGRQISVVVPASAPETRQTVLLGDLSRLLDREAAAALADPGSRRPMTQVLVGDQGHAGCRDESDG